MQVSVAVVPGQPVQGSPQYLYLLISPPVRKLVVIPGPQKMQALNLNSSAQAIFKP